MKKIVVLLSIVILLATGCSIKKLDDYDFPKNMDYLLSKKNKLYNVYYDGYKYYLPKGVTFINKDDYNALLKDQYNNKYYLYVDLISYYHNVENSYDINSDSYYSKKIDINKKNEDNAFGEDINDIKLELEIKRSEVEHLSNIIKTLQQKLQNANINKNNLEKKIMECTQELRQRGINI